MNDEIDKQISSRMHSIFPNPTIATKIVNLVTSKRPIGWGRKSYAPYYKEWCAKEIRDAIDKMLVNGQSIIYRYTTWCNEDTGMSHQTLYYRVNQSIRYLIECMDEEQVYKKWYDRVRVRREKGLGVIVEFIPGLDTNSNCKPEFVKPTEQMPVWKRHMEEWLESDDTNPFIIEHLALSEDEVRELKIQFSQLTNVAASIDARGIKVIRLNDK